MQLLYKWPTYFAVNFVISGIDTNDKQSLNKLSISPLLNFEISGKDANDEQPLNIDFLEQTSKNFHFEISGYDDNDEQPLNI